MKRAYLITTLSLLLCVFAVSNVWGQRQPAPSEYSGTEYYISFPPSDPDAAHPFLGLLITSEFSTTGWLEIPNIPASDLEPITSFETVPFAIKGGQVIVKELSRFLEPKFNDEASLRTVRLVSRAPVSVTVINVRAGSSGGYPVLPIDRWGTEYFPTALPEVSPKLVGVTSQILITAAHDETNISIRPAARTTFYKAGQLVQITLDKGETYLIQADTLEGTDGLRDLSTTSITSNQPIGVVAGHTRAALSSDPLAFLSRQQYAAWHMTMQLPANNWGNEYFTVPMRSSGDRFRLMPLTGNTVVKATFYDDNGNQIQQKEISLRWAKQAVDVYAPEGASLNTPVKWESDKPFTLTQLRLTNGTYANPDNSPAMVRTVSTELYTSNAMFGLPTSIDDKFFNAFDLQLIAQGDGGNPFHNVSVDGTPATQLSGVEIKQISGATWRLRAEIGAGGHRISAVNNVRFTGHVSGHNGQTGGVTLAWELPHWSADIERDVIPPVVKDWSSYTQGVNVVISDETDTYFSGVETVELYNSPGWTQETFFPPLNRDDDASTRFTIKNGVDPSGPLWLLLRDYDGNERITKVFDGVCNKTAYLDAATDTVHFTIEDKSSAESIIRVDANPCGDEAELTWARYDLGASANQYLEDPIVANNQPTPYSIQANGTLEITVKTKAGIPDGTYTTTLELIIDGNTYKVPITVVAKDVSSVSDEARLAEDALLASPNPTTGSTTLVLSTPLSRSGKVEITDARGIMVQSFTAADVVGTTHFTWTGTKADGTPLPPGVYFVTLNNGNATITKRVVLIR